MHWNLFSFLLKSSLVEDEVWIDCGRSISLQPCPHTLRLYPDNIPQAHNLALSVEQWQRVTVGNIQTEEADLCLFWDFWSWISNKESQRSTATTNTNLSLSVICGWRWQRFNRLRLRMKKLIYFGYYVSHEKANTCLIGLNGSIQTIQTANCFFPSFHLVQTRTVTLQESTHPDEMPLVKYCFLVTCMENSTNDKIIAN